MWKKNKKKQTNKQPGEKQKLTWYPSPVPSPTPPTHPHPPPPTHTSYFKSTTLHPSLPPLICNNNAMDMVFLVQMRQSHKCVSVRNDEVFNLNLGSGAGPWVSIPCLLQDTSHIYWFHLLKRLTRKKQRIQKWDPTPNKSYRTALAYIHKT